MPKSPLKPKKCQKKMPKNAKNGQKMQKRTKCKNLELTQAHPHHTRPKKMTKKPTKSTVYCKKKSGGVKINQKNTKNAISQKGLVKRF